MYLLPKPKEVKSKEGKFYVNHNARIVVDTKIHENETVLAGLIQESMEKWAGISLAVMKGKPEAGDIFLTLAPEAGEQGYELVVGEDGVTVKGGDGAGVMYGVQTLCQMITQCGGVLPCLEIVDSPDFMHRGYYLDQTRGRVLKLDNLKKVVDLLSRYKINEFQFYIEHTYLFRGFSEMWRDETPLTAQEIMELDKYCRERSVELVPSLSSFGHLYMLLSTKSYGELSELENSEKQPFSFVDRMRHHTVNVSDERVLPLIKGMIKEYMSLFSSDKFNICADETFDLGKGRAKSLADEKGVHRIYIDYVKELCGFLIEKGKQPMFWGDIICGEPELISELPENVICLTWGYAPDQDDEACRKMAEAGAKQYLCPGVSGWNQWLNLIGDSYQNIMRMCTYARKYNNSVMGILNTDWGDFGHINHPEYSVPGMIYGAAFSWNQEIIPFEEINRQIAEVEFHDASGELVNLLAKAAGLSVFKWWGAEMYYEHKELGVELQEYAKRELSEGTAQLKAYAKEGVTAQANAALKEIRKQLKKTAVSMDSAVRKFLADCDVTLDGMEIWNEIGAALAETEEIAAAEDECVDMAERFALAERLENWFMSYKEMWRKVSREGDLAHIAEVVFWYADRLRGRERSKKALPYT